jgi:hypothetical protein
LKQLSPELSVIFNASKAFSSQQEADKSLEKELNYDYLLALALGNGVLPLLNESIFEKCDIAQ